MHARTLPGMCAGSRSATSLQAQWSDCLVALFEGEDLYEAPAWYTSVLTVLDLAAGGRMLCRMEDIMCALPPRAPCAAH